MENKMYPFIDTVINEKYIPEYIPTSAMFYDGVLLEGVIEGYQTLSVTGREMISVNIESEAVQVGSIVTNQKLPSRTLTVQYKLSNKDPKVLQVKFDSLKRRLYRLQDVPIQFNDELDYTYYGRFSSSQTPPGDTNSIVSSFEIFCADPRKYTKQFKTPGLISTYTPYQILPDNIRVVLNRPTSVAVSNGDKVMSITGAGIASGDVIDFMPKEGKVFVNGLDKTSILDLSSDFKNFFISKGDIVKTNNGKLEVSYRAVML